MNTDRTEGDRGPRDATRRPFACVAANLTVGSGLRNDQAVLRLLVVHSLLVPLDHLVRRVEVDAVAGTPCAVTFVVAVITPTSSDLEVRLGHDGWHRSVTPKAVVGLDG